MVYSTAKLAKIMGVYAEFRIYLNRMERGNETVANSAGAYGALDDLKKMTSRALRRALGLPGLEKKLEKLDNAMASY